MVNTALFYVIDYSHYVNVGLLLRIISHLKNNRYTGENNRANFQKLQNRIISKTKSIIGSGLVIGEVIGKTKSIIGSGLVIGEVLLLLSYLEHSQHL